MKDHSRFLCPERLSSVYRKFLEEPNRTFILVDFFPSRGNNRKYLNCLVNLGLIKRVDVVYNVGGINQGRKNTKGYRLKREVQLKGGDNKDE